MTIVNFHLSLDTELSSKIPKSQLQLDLIPKHHGRSVIVVLSSAQILVSNASDSLVPLADMLRLDDLGQFSLTLVPKLFNVNQGLTFLLDFDEEVFLLLERVTSQLFVNILDMVLPDVKSVSHWEPFGPVDEPLGLPGDLLLEGGHT